MCLNAHVVSGGMTFATTLQCESSASVTAEPEPHILVVDDDVAMRNMIADYLVENFLHVTQAATGATMLAVFAQHVTGIVLLDPRLGRENGMQLAQKLSRPNGAAVTVRCSSENRIDVGCPKRESLPKPDGSATF
jgi:response regulator RpfG family c-di-GMP phosphodiesterase